jgi:hypothetical protein
MKQSKASTSNPHIPVLIALLIAAGLTYLPVHAHAQGTVGRGPNDPVKTREMETQQGQPISIGAYSNYGFSDCTNEEPPVINIINKPIHGGVVVLHRTYVFKPSDSTKCTGKPAEFSIVIYEPSHTDKGIVEIEYEVVFLTYKETGLVKEPNRFTYLVNVK